MGSLSFPSVSTCDQNWFRSLLNPLCPDLSFVQRIASFAVPLLILGSMVSFCYVIYCHLIRSQPQEDSSSNIFKQVNIDRSRSPSPKRKKSNPYSYSPLAVDTIDNARLRCKEYVKTHESEGSTLFKSEDGQELTQPKNKEIHVLTRLCYLLNRDLKLALKSHCDDPWNNKEVIRIAGEYMEVAFAANCLMFEDLRLFTLEKKTAGEKLTDKTAYQSQVFFLCARSYHLIRTEVTYQPKDEKKKEGYYPNEKISDSFAVQFYQEGTPFNDMNRLYNEFCQLVDTYTGVALISTEVDPRFYKASQPDMDKDTFHVFNDKIRLTDFELVG